MNKISSNMSLLPLSHVAEDAGISRQTLYAWLDQGLVTHVFDVAGRPCFTGSERDAVVELAKARESARANFKLVKVG